MFISNSYFISIISRISTFSLYLFLSFCSSLLALHPLLASFFSSVLVQCFNVQCSVFSILFPFNLLSRFNDTILRLSVVFPGLLSFPFPAFQVCLVTSPPYSSLSHNSLFSQPLAVSFLANSCFLSRCFLSPLTVLFSRCFCLFWRLFLEVRFHKYLSVSSLLSLLSICIISFFVLL